LERFVSDGWPSVQTLNPKLDEALKQHGMGVCDVERVSLVPGAPDYILVSLDVNGRYFCNSVLRIRRWGVHVFSIPWKRGGCNISETRS
jgi:hypothetical protein